MYSWLVVDTVYCRVVSCTVCISASDVSRTYCGIDMGIDQKKEEATKHRVRDFHRRSTFMIACSWATSGCMQPFAFSALASTWSAKSRRLLARHPTGQCAR